MLDRYDQDLLLDYLEGELAADRRAELEAMLAEDTELAQLLEQMSHDRAALRSLPPAELPGDLAHDVTQSLERRMLLDEDAFDVGPIPIARGRALPNETTGGPRWGRIAGLSALAASVAVAAGIVVITLEHDPLTETAERLADDTGGELADTESAFADAVSDDSALFDGALPDPADARTADITPPGAATGDTLRPTDLADGVTESAAPIDGLATEPEALAHADSIREREASPRLTVVDRVLQPQQPVALAVTEPNRQLVLFSEKPELTQEQLIAYCVGNSIPIVQTSVPLNTVDDGFGDGSERSDADADAIEPAALDNNYALLVDEKQLDDLVLTMNNDITLDREDIARGVFFSNQAAVVTDLPAEPIQRRRAAIERSSTEQAEARPAALLDEAQADSAPPQQQNAAAQTPIELQLPEDLGSAYANSRNRTNLYVEQRRNQLQYNQRAELADESLVRDAAEETDSSDAGDLARALQSDPSQSDAVQPAEDAGESADKSERMPAELDPARGNWLAPHLPLANTTPILTWRHTPAEPPARLVPVFIQRAPTDRVNALRVEQQAELSKRAEQTETPPPEADESSTEEVPDSDEDANEAPPAE